MHIEELPTQMDKKESKKFGCVEQMYYFCTAKSRMVQ